MRMTSGRRELEAPSVRRVRMRGNGFGGSAVESGIGIEKPKTYGKSRAEVDAFCFPVGQRWRRRKRGKEKDTKSNFPLPACGFSTGRHGMTASIGHRRKDTTQITFQKHLQTATTQV